MKKRVYGRKLSRGRGARKALYRSLIKALIDHGKITTTKAKVKSIQSDIDKLITLAKKKSDHSARIVLSKLANDRKRTKVLLDTIVPSMKDINSGYTKITMLPKRRGDAADMATIRWTKDVVEEKKVEEKKVAKKKVSPKKDTK